MTQCDHNLSRRLLDGALSPQEEAAVEQHLGQCPRCQAWLEHAAGDACEWSATRELLARSAERAQWTPAGIESIADTQPQFVPGADEDESGRPPLVDLSFLAPSDDPAYLGRVGAYEIAGVIGQGGMGVVLKAVDRSLSRHVAIKVLSPMLAHAGAARQRFAREARAMAALSHEHVVPIYAVDEHRGLPYFAMEYVPGGTLAARLAKEGPLEVVAIVRIAMQTALALAAAHDSGLVHRDIKPANILLDRGTERVRVTDFGLARAASEASDTASGMLAGTPQYMSPEQINHDSCDARSDLFSLGSVMYAMCAGHAPFRAESVFAVLQRIVHQRPRPVREVNSHVPEWLAAFIERLMAKDREARFPSAAEVAELLEQELAHLQNPGHAPAPPRLWQPRRRALSRGDAPGGRRAKFGAAMIAALVAAAFAWRSGSINTPALSPAPASGNAAASSETFGSASPPTAPRAPWDAAGRASAGSRSSSPLEPATVPLWDADGIEIVQQYANALEYGAAIAPGAAVDPWSRDVSELQQNMDLLQDESQVPKF
jgi:serine/threonine-protein kinase